MENIKKTAIRFKNHVKRNKLAYSFGVVAVAAIALQQSNKNAFYKFLEEKGINPMEYYYPEGFEMLKERGA